MADSELVQGLLGLAALALELAKDAGADDAWARTSRYRDTEFSVRDGKIEKVQASTSRGLGLRLYVDGRYSTHNTTDLRRESLQSFIRDAVALTRALEPDPHRLIPSPALFEGRSTIDLDLFDRAVLDITPEDRLAWANAMNESLVGKPKVISATSSISDGHGASASMSSNGFSGAHEASSIWMGSEVTLQGAGDKKPEGSMWGGARHRDDLPDPLGLAAQALERAVLRLDEQKGPTTRTTMVVHPMVSRHLVARLLSPAHAASLQQGRSFYAGKKNEKLFPEIVTIIDDPLLPRGLASRHFDGEGIAAKPMTLIDAGVVKNFYVDTYYGRKLGEAPTTGGSSNRVMKLGKHDLSALVASVGDGILVEGWLGGNADATTGEFSLGCRGRRIEGGALTQSVAEMNVTGNLVELFGRLLEVGNDPWPYGALLVPTLVFGDVQFGGA